MRKIIFKICGLMCCMAMFVAQASASNICIWKAYQPKVPKSLLDE
ncbi:MAG: cyclic lactone autoinducer peptide [Monoglobales bacterium]